MRSNSYRIFYSMKNTCFWHNVFFQYVDTQLFSLVLFYPQSYLQYFARFLMDCFPLSVRHLDFQENFTMELKKANYEVTLCFDRTNLWYFRYLNFGHKVICLRRILCIESIAAIDCLYFSFCLDFKFLIVFHFTLCKNQVFVSKCPFSIYSNQKYSAEFSIFPTCDSFPKFLIFCFRLLEFKITIPIPKYLLMKIYYMVKTHFM